MIQWADIARLYRYWLEAPPVHELVAGFLGVKAPPSAALPDDRPDIGMSFDEMRRLAESGAGQVVG
jgi:hypothetical protein